MIKKEYTAEFLIKRAETARGTKSSWNNEYKEVYKYVQPSHGIDRNGNDKNSQSFQDDRAGLYTSIGEESLDEFAATMQEIMTPPEDNWIGLQEGLVGRMRELKMPNIDQVIQEQMGGLMVDKAELDNINVFANEAKNISNFDQVAPQVYKDMGVGTGAMIILGDDETMLNFRAIPYKEYSIEEDATGAVDKVFREFKIRRENVGSYWPNLAAKYMTADEEDLEKQVEFIECTYKFDDGVEAPIYKYVVIDTEKKQVMMTTDHDTNPFIIPRLGKAPGDIYGRGPATKTIANIKTLNKIMEYSLRAFAFNIPTFIAIDDGAFDYSNFKLQPGAVNLVPMDNAVQPLKVNTDKNLETYQIETREMNIKKQMLASTLPDVSRERTATEIIKISDDLKKVLTPIYGTLKQEWIKPLTMRIIDVLYQQGYLSAVAPNFNVKMINNIAYSVKVSSMLTRQLKTSSVQNIVNTAQLFLQFDPSGKALDRVLKMDETLTYIADNMGTPPQLIKDSNQQKATALQHAENDAADKDEALENELIMKQAGGGNV